MREPSITETSETEATTYDTDVTAEGWLFYDQYSEICGANHNFIYITLELTSLEC
uniref:Cytochrome oxidase subunit II copper A binding domain-containing protein n=1 Tax=Wuchereria bancrofti TaxID=6293 RepID=A0AAF5RY37_WUCBA